MTIQLDVYESDNSTFVDTLTSERGVRWADDRVGVGRLSFRISADAESATTLISEGRVVRVNDGSSDLFGAVVRSQTKRRFDGDRANVDVDCVGLRGLLDASPTDPEGGLASGTLDLDRSLRIFGWQSPNSLFDHSSWAAAVSHGRQDSDPFSTPRPDDWPGAAASAEFIWSTHTAGKADPGTVYFRKSFTTAVAQDVVWVGTADDEATFYIDGQEIGTIGGHHQWQRYLVRTFTLPAGSHVLAVRGKNYTSSVGDGTSLAWVLGALLVADPDGDPTSQDEVFTLSTTATGGTHALTFDDYSAFNADWDATVAELQSAFDSAIGSGAVTVSGSDGGPWTITCDGDDTTGRAHSLSVDSTNLTGGTSSVANPTDGAYNPLIIKTDTTWRHLPYPASVPGVTFGAIWKTLFDEAVARSEIDGGVTSSATASLDTDGNAWTTQVELAIPVGTKLNRVVVMLEEVGADFHIAADGTVTLVESLGTDKSATVQVGYGTNAAGVEHRRDGARYDRLVVRTVEGIAEITAGTPGSPVRSLYLAAGSFPTAAALEAWTDAIIADYAAQADVTRVDIAEESSGVQPYTDFGLGDTIALTNWQNVPTKQRALSLEAKVDDDTGEVDWTVEATDSGVRVALLGSSLHWRPEDLPSSGDITVWDNAGSQGSGYDLTTADSGKNPPQVLASALDGYRAARFTSAGTTGLSSSSTTEVATAGGGATHAWVVRVNANENKYLNFSQTTTAAGLHAVLISGKIRIRWGQGTADFLASSEPAGTWHLLVATFPASTDAGKLWTDGVLQADQPDDLLSGLAGIDVGFTGSSHANVDFVEGLVYERDLDADGDLDALHAYFAQKYPSLGVS